VFGTDVISGRLIVAVAALVDGGRADERGESTTLLPTEQSVRS
jgi:hypothetical protein